MLLRVVLIRRFHCVKDMAAVLAVLCKMVVRTSRARK
jgi:hypothetical protein